MLKKIQKFVFKRIKTDYSYIHNWFINTLTPMLIHLKKINAPPPLGIEQSDWDFDLDKMIFHLKMMDIKNILKEKQIMNPPNPTNNDYILAEHIKKRNTKHFFELFEKYFF